MNGARLWIATAPPRRRTGIKGPRAAEVLISLGLTPPPAPNSWAPLTTEGGEAADELVARLGNTEYFVEEASPGEICARLDACRESGAYPVIREDVALVLGGVDAPRALAEVCNVDFTSLAPGRPLYLTLMIGVAVLVLPQRRADGVVFRIWCDPSFGPYLQEALEGVVHRIQSGRAT